MQENRELIIEEGRAGVRMAFGVVEGPSSSGALFTGQRPTSRKKSTKRRRQFTGDKDEIYPDATRVYATETRNAGSSRPPLPDQRMTGFVHRCIKELNALEQNWVRFRYRDQHQSVGSPGHMFMRAYSELYIAAYLDTARAGTRDLIRQMIAFRMEQLCNWHRLKDVPFQPIGAHISRQLWSKTYKKHWERVCTDLARVDGAALYKVGVKINLY